MSNLAIFSFYFRLLDRLQAPWLWGSSRPSSHTSSTLLRESSRNLRSAVCRLFRVSCGVGDGAGGGQHSRVAGTEPCNSCGPIRMHRARSVGCAPGGGAEHQTETRDGRLRHRDVCVPAGHRWVLRDWGRRGQDVSGAQWELLFRETGSQTQRDLTLTRIQRRSCGVSVITRNVTCSWRAYSFVMVSMFFLLFFHFLFFSLFFLKPTHKVTLKAGCWNVLPFKYQPNNIRTLLLHYH